MASQPQQRTRSFFFLALQLLIILSSFSFACIAGFYLHPFVLSIVHLIESMEPQLRSVLQGCLTAVPFRFVLVNVVVGALYFTSGMAPRAKGHPDFSTMSETRDRNADLPDGKSDGQRAKVESKSGKPFLRLVRSKSDLIASPTRRMEYAASRLTKAGTFELRSRSVTALKRVVIVADPPEDEQPLAAGSEEVDKRAEDFIGKFYQNVKLEESHSQIDSRKP